MKIYVNAIPPEGLNLKESIDASELNLETEQIRYSGKVLVSAYVTRDKDIISVDCDIDLRCDYTCSRCLAEFESKFKKSANFVYKLSGENTIELNDNVRDTIVLEYPMKILCKPDCKGLCHNCGRNLNAEPCECQE